VGFEVVCVSSNVPNSFTKVASGDFRYIEDIDIC